MPGKEQTHALFGDRTAYEAKHALKSNVEKALTGEMSREGLDTIHNSLIEQADRKARELRVASAALNERLVTLGLQWRELTGSRDGDLNQKINAYIEEWAEIDSIFQQLEGQRGNRQRDTPEQGVHSVSTGQREQSREAGGIKIGDRVVHPFNQDETVGVVFVAGAGSKLCDFVPPAYMAQYKQSGGKQRIGGYQVLEGSPEYHSLMQDTSVVKAGERTINEPYAEVEFNTDLEKRTLAVPTSKLKPAK